MDKEPDAFKTISEAAEQLSLPQHVLRFWETKFTAIKPMKRGGRRYYRPSDIKLLAGIKFLLYGKGYTIKGVQRILREQGASYVMQSPHLDTESRQVDSEARQLDSETAVNESHIKVPEIDIRSDDSPLFSTPAQGVEDSSELSRTGLPQESVINSSVSDVDAPSPSHDHVSQNNVPIGDNDPPIHSSPAKGQVSGDRSNLLDSLQSGLTLAQLERLEDIFIEMNECKRILDQTISENSV